MVLSRRAAVRSLAAGVLGSAAVPMLAGCEGLSGAGSPGTNGPPTSGTPVVPDGPLVLGQIGASVGWTAAVEDTIALAVSQALIDVNAAYGGVFDREVATAGTRHVISSLDEDLTGIVEEMADAGAGAVICSLPDEAMLSAAPVMASAGIAMIDVTTSSLALRDPALRTAGMLARLSPSTRAIAARLAEVALGASASDRTGDPGSVAMVHDGSELGSDLLSRLASVLAPQGGQIMLEESLPAVDEDASGLAGRIAEARPALLVIHGSAAASAALSAAVHDATSDADGRIEPQIPVSISPAATVDQRGAGLPEGALGQVVGWMPGGEIPEAHARMMLNEDPALARSAFPYSQLGYDAVMIACLAAQHALSVQGSDIAASIPQVLTGTVECVDPGACADEITARRRAGESPSITYVGSMGALTLGADGDPATGRLRTYRYGDDGALALDQTVDYEDEV